MSVLCLNMIVKNESAVIRRCLASVRPWIDAWVIVDTGSTDGTQDLIREALAGIPGELHQRPWVDFATNRTEAIDLARGRGDYLLFIDADEELVVPAGFQPWTLQEEAYMVDYHYGGLVYARPSLVATRVAWAYEGVLHEYLVRRDGGSALPAARWDGPYVQVRPEGARSQDPEKFRKDAAVLEKALVDQPDHARYAFYLAQSYRDAGEPEKALAAYERRAGMVGSLEETWHALYQAARLREFMGRPEADVIHAYRRAHQNRPTRAEPLGCLARYLRLKQRWSEAAAAAEAGMCLPLSTDALFVERDWYAWGCLDEFAVAAYWVGRYRDSLEACERLLAEGCLPDVHLERVRANRACARQALDRPPEPGGLRLHLGCGRTLLDGWINLDGTPLPGVDLVVDLEDCQPGRIPLADDSVVDILASHVLEHIRSPLPLLQELYRISLPGARCVIRVPYGSSDDAWEDPTHVRPYFTDSFGYFSQPYYWRADYGYRGDWDLECLELFLHDPALQGAPPEDIAQAVRERRNVVREMVATLRAVKPMREPRAELRKAVPLAYRW